MPDRTSDLSLDRIQLGDADIPIAGLGREIDDATRFAGRSIRTRRDQADKPVKAVARPGLTLAWTQEDEDAFDPIALLSPRQAAAVAIKQYDAAWANIMRRIES